MVSYTNADILSAVLMKWLQPCVNQFASAKLSKIPFVSNIESKVKASGWVTQSWSAGAELAPLIQDAGSAIVEPILKKYLSNIPDKSIPNMAHSLVDSALKNGELKLFDGNIIFDNSDLTELKNLLSYNLPIAKSNTYVVKEK